MSQPSETSTDLKRAAEATAPRESFLSSPHTLSAEEKLSGDMLVLTTGLMVLASVLGVLLSRATGKCLRPLA